jgi:hypothetical protein
MLSEAKYAYARNDPVGNSDFSHPLGMTTLTQRGDLQGMPTPATYIVFTSILFHKYQHATLR